jgi:rare lipoprotein A
MQTMMRTHRIRTILIALTAAGALLATLSAGAQASTGGSSGPTGGLPKVHKSAIATWFGPGFYGQQTACGQTLTPEVIGVANRTLPCGTLVKVSYHGHAITVPVLDRGPFANGANWDLTAGAAEALGIEDTVRIGTRVVGSVANTPTLGAPAIPPEVLAAGGAQAEAG